MKPDQVDRIRGDYYEIIKRRPWFRNEENSETQDSIIQVNNKQTNSSIIPQLPENTPLNLIKLELRIKKIVSADMVESRL